MSTTHRVTVVVTVDNAGTATATCLACPDAHLTAPDTGTWEPPEVKAFRSSHEHRSEARDPEPVHGMCTACGSVEVLLIKPTGTRDLSSIGESPEYPTGYGCEVCS